jgi:molybdopterin-guanine dinucleotide biosynthesis protein A
MNQIEGFVLNGGMSSRMGAPKVRCDSVNLHLPNMLRRRCLPFATACTRLKGKKRLTELKRFRCRLEGQEERASIFGLRSALLHSSTKYAAILACDMPFVTGEVISRLAADMSALEKEQADAIIPSDKNGWLQPLCAIYERDRCRGEIDAYLMTESGKFAA